MITVIEMLSLPAFYEFKLISGHSGLHNTVLGTGIFEWESDEDIERNFSEGEFVITTLSQAKSSPEKAEGMLRKLIDKKVSSIGIKTIYFHQISQELQEYSNKHQVPLFFFQETYFDDIIFAIKNALAANLVQVDYETCIHHMFRNDLTKEETEKFSRELNPFFFSHIQCFYLHPKNAKPIVEDTMEALKRGISSKQDPFEEISGLYAFRGGILVIHSQKRGSLKEERNNFSDLPDFWTLDIPFLRDYRMGAGNCHMSLSSIGTAIQESVYAYASACIRQENYRHFSTIGLDQMLMPVAQNSWVQAYSKECMKRITDYDEKHHAKLRDTLFEYIICNGDILLTSKKIFQHGNTVRYRLEKIRFLLGLQEERDFYPPLYSIVRMELIQGVLDKF